MTYAFYVLMALGLLCMSVSAGFLMAAHLMQKKMKRAMDLDNEGAMVREFNRRMQETINPDEKFTVTVTNDKTGDVLAQIEHCNAACLITQTNDKDFLNYATDSMGPKKALAALLALSHKTIDRSIEKMQDADLVERIKKARTFLKDI